MKRMSLLVLLSSLALIHGPAQAGNVDAGKAKSEACSDCHGADGKGDPDNPAIVGMSVEAFTKAMKEYQAEVRTKNKKMIRAAKKTSDEDIADLAAYYATLKK